jgi:hypothetical protein
MVENREPGLRSVFRPFALACLMEDFRSGALVFVAF